MPIFTGNASLYSSCTCSSDVPESFLSSQSHKPFES